MSTTIFRRTVVGAVAIAGALSLAACNNDSAAVDTPTGAATSTAQSTQAEPPPSEESAEGESSTTSPESESSETSSESSTESSESSTGTSGSADGPTSVTDANATLKIGQPAVIEDSDDTYRLTPKSLEVAPDSVYSETTLKKANGTVYYLKFDVTAIKANSTYFGTNSVNGLFFHPKIDASVKGAKRVYGHTAACDSDSTKLAAGESGNSCYMFQVPGATVDSVVFNDYKHNITWNK
ncbi:hypothetical protein GCM10011492_16270 [Flexivirga endophytica]|uniref:DUF4352 domain-containing protein n=1 Tax=Flexivirga endophytica TaxID=1849103 RepID=A0A916T0W9_9MICO|nr:hypothetical protein [Flexivirga endophytica]GGB26740.1 hypothetical protein GCM10011492_16270 [Flexivirga endophytica]GHB55218.1 hypothetical protein GCM10008112_25580 [Flexivirga endophytica]